MTTDQKQAAFNAGCDARIRGQSLNDNPHKGRQAVALWATWRDGWIDVDTAWCRQRRGPRTALPRVKGG